MSGPYSQRIGEILERYDPAVLAAAARQGGGLFPGDHYRWLRSPGQVVLGVFGDGVHGVALRGVVAVR